MSTETQPGASRPVTAGGYDEATFTRLAADAAEIVGRYPEPRSALLPMLHLVQSEDGFVSRNGVNFCAEILSITSAEVSAVATFYSQYKRRPNGEYTVGVCTNTLCAIMGGDEIFDELSERLGIGHDETTEDGKITLERVECNAACDYAPVMMINWEFFDNQTPERATAVVDAILAGKKVAPTRGADSVSTFKETSRVLAGFLDGRADEGVGAGAPTIEGTVLAKKKGWKAPVDGSTPAASPSPAADATPATGGEQSSAERKPTTPSDTKPAADTKPEAGR